MPGRCFGPADSSALAAGISPALVDIYTTRPYLAAQAAGTGMVLTAGGEVLTNNHVIEGAGTIRAVDVGNGSPAGPSTPPGPSPN